MNEFELPWALRAERLGDEFFVDRPSWREGPWSPEPDLVEWRHEASGYLLFARRTALGAWCGYVGLPLRHPLYGASLEKARHRLEYGGHGGLTFAGVAPAADGVLYWVGFDCGHALDYQPGLSHLMEERYAKIESYFKDFMRPRYVTLDEVRDDAEGLAAAAFALANEAN